jgi:hypothetical protein
MKVEMNQNLDDVFAKIHSLEKDARDLRSNYSGLNKSYIFTLTNLKELTLHSTEAASRAAYYAEQSKISAMNAAVAAKETSNSPTLILLVIANFTGASAAALAALESAAAATSSAAAASAAEATFSSTLVADSINET